MLLSIIVAASKRTFSVQLIKWVTQLGEFYLKQPLTWLTIWVNLCIRSQLQLISQKKVLSVYTHSMQTIYPSLSAQVAKSTLFMKSPIFKVNRLVNVDHQASDKTFFTRHWKVWECLKNFFTVKKLRIHFNIKIIILSINVAFLFFLNPIFWGVR